jgi:hypothetical protein
MADMLVNPSTPSDSSIPSTGVEDLVGKYQLQTASAADHLSLPQEIAHGAVAAVTDFATSTWNSIVPHVISGTEASTSDLLSRIDKDALQVYQEHPDAIHTASLVGGVFAPAGLALKGMKLLREGSKGVSWFSQAGEVSRLAEVETSFKNSIGVSKAFEDSKKVMYGAMAANALVDNVAAEAAIVMTMNAHPMMEDYMKDAKSNFLLSAVVGTGIGGIVGAIGTNAAIRGVTQPIAKEAMGEVFKGMKAVPETMNMGNQLITRAENIGNWEASLAKHNNPLVDYSLTPFAVTVLEHSITANKARILTDFEKMSVGELADAPVGLKNYWTDLMKDGIKFQNVDTIEFAKVESSVSKEGEKVGFLTGVQDFLKKVTNAKTGETSTVANKTAYIPEHDAFVTTSEMQDYLSLADTGLSLEALKKNHPSFGLIPNHDAFLEAGIKSTAEIEADHARAFLFVDSLDAAGLNKLVINPDDLAMTKAVIAKIGNLPAEEAMKVKVTMTREVPKDSTVASSSKVGLSDLVDAASSAELKLSKHLLDSGFKDESISKRIGISNEAYQDGKVGTGMLRYSSEEDIIKALDPRNRAVVLGTNMNKVPYSELRSNLNDRTASQINIDLVEKYISTNPDEIVRGLQPLLGSSSAKQLLQHLEGGLEEVTTAAYRNTLFSSANFAVENFGVSGTIATTIGKDITHYINQATEKLVVPIAQKMSKIVKEEALVVEANMAMTVNASLTGKRIYRDGQFFQQVKNHETGEMEEVAAQFQGKEFKITSPEVLSLFDEFEKAGRSVYQLGNTSNKILGKTPVTDLGFWIPSFNPRNKELAYVIDHSSDNTQILWGKTAGELNDKVAAYTLKAKNEGRNVDVVSKDSNLQHFNTLVGREDPMFMQMADVSMLHTGASANAIISTNTELLTEVINSYDHLVSKGITNIVDIQLAPVMDKLKLISELSQRGHNPEAMGVVKKGASSLADPGMTMRNILLGQGQLSQHKPWAEFQQKLQVGTDIALSKLSEITLPVMQKLGSGVARDEESFTLLNKQLEEKGLMPFKAVEDFLRYRKEGVVGGENLTPRAVALSNALAATTLLKFMELAQPFVNMISLPILTSGAMRKQMAKSFMGTEVSELPAHYGVIQNTYDAVRLMNHPIEGAKWTKLAEDRTLFRSVVSEADEAMRHTRSLDPGLMAKGEAFVRSKFIEKASFAADWSETKVRQMSFFNGVVLAKKAYPGLSDDGVMTFARSFMDEALGNYSSSQRPAAFQGTFGVAMGLFQTYMLTLAQQMYRGIERKDWIGLSKQMLAQTTIFGASSLPGFHVVSEQIGAHFSDQHTDLETGLFRTIGDSNATTLLYGAPSLFGMGTTTRGDIQPRLPNPLTGLDSLAAVNLTKQAWAAGVTLGKAASQTDGNTGRAMAEALSVQSISRPVARMSELFSGRSLTGKGDVVASNLTANPFSDNFTTLGLIARTLATRPIEEIKAREAIHLNSVYQGVDGDKKKALTGELKTAIRNGDLTSDSVQRMQYEYLRVGSPQGWRQSVNRAMMEEVKGGTASVKDRLHPNAPYQQMVEDLG